jgi:hypothetical protein
MGALVSDTSIGVVGMAARRRRVKLDVRWDAEDVQAAQGAAAALGVRPAVVMRAAVKLGLMHPELARALRAESTPVRGPRASAVHAGEAGTIDGERLLSGVMDKMAGAAAAPPGGAPPGPSSRPVPAARPQQRVKLAVVIARRLRRVPGRFRRRWAPGRCARCAPG